MHVRHCVLSLLLIVVPTLAQAAKPEVAAPATPPPAASAPAFRVWSDTSGKFKVEAALVTADEKNVELRKKADGVLGIWEGQGQNFTITLSIPKAGLASRMINFAGGEVAVGGYLVELADDGRSFAARDASGTLDEEGQLIYADIVRRDGAAPVELRMPLKRIASSAQLEAQTKRKR